MLYIQTKIKKMEKEKDEIEQVHEVVTLSLKEERDSYKISNQSLQSEAEGLKV